MLKLAKPSEADLEELRLERNKLLDENCLCKVGPHKIFGANSGMSRIVYHPHCPLNHQSLFMSMFFNEDWLEVQKRWPYKEEFQTI